jgi:hypothetical protein
MRHVLGSIPIVLAVLAATGCADSATEPVDLAARVHVAAVDDSDVKLGAIVDGDALTVYACGGPQTFATHTRWFDGRFGTDDDPNAFAIDVDGFRLEGERTVEGITGVFVDPDGTEHAFAAEATDDAEPPGLYTGAADGCTTGVVVLPDLSTQGTYCNADGEFIQVIILRPGDLSANGFEVQVDRPEGPLTLQVDPA